MKHYFVIYPSAKGCPASLVLIRAGSARSAWRKARIYGAPEDLRDALREGWDSDMNGPRVVRVSRSRWLSEGQRQRGVWKILQERAAQVPRVQPLQMATLSAAAGEVVTLPYHGLPLPPKRLYRAPCCIPHLVLKRAETWASERKGANGYTVLRDGKGRRFVCELFDGVQQVGDTCARTLASRKVWASSRSALVQPDGQILRGGGDHWTDWRTYDHPSGTRRTVKP